VRAAGAALGYRRADGAGAGLTVDGAVTGGTQGVAGTVEFPTPEARREDRQAQVAAEVVRGDRRAWFTLAAHAGRQRRSYTDPERAIADRHLNGVLGLGLRWDRRLAAGADRNTVRTTGAPAAGDRGQVTAGIELERAALVSTTDGDRVRHAAALYARGEFGRGGLALAPAARLDMATEHGPIVSPRLALALALPGIGELRAAVGRAYRPPSFDDLFAADRGASVGNPALAPEHATEVELGVALTFALAGDPARLAASAFHQEIGALIQWTPGPDGRWRPHNVRRAVLRGVELEGSVPLAGRGLAAPARLDLAVTFLDARDRSGDAQTDGRILPYRAQVEGRADLLVPLRPATRVLAGWRGVGRSFVTAANTKSLPGYGLLDLTLEQAIGRGVTASLAVLNAGGVAAVDVRHYPLPGREWRVAVRAAIPEVF
jgi:outer membrane cobalamin receptor